MDEPDLQDLRRDEVAAIVENYGSTTMGVLRALYGEDFAPGFGDDSRLGSIALLLDEPSLGLLLDDHGQGTLAAKLAV